MPVSSSPTMRAAVYRGQSAVRVEAVPVPAIGPGELLVRVESCGICHTDLKKVEYDLLPPPRIYGHETAGVVAAVGEGVTKFKVGRSRRRLPPHPLRQMLLLRTQALRPVRRLQKGGHYRRL
jgi:NADPH:quinone reductase-like Zn-dependent oxidoreductase